jgi:Fe2+ transport system protein FeoA
MPDSQKTLADLSEIVVAKVLTVLGDDPVSERLREMGFATTIRGAANNH